MTEVVDRNAVVETDELVEKVARAIAIYRANNPYGSLEDQARAAIASLSSSNAMGRNAIIEECAKCVPTSWLDDLLTGPGRTPLPWEPFDIERLLRGVESRIRSLSASPASPSIPEADK